MLLKTCKINSRITLNENNVEVTKIWILYVTQMGAGKQTKYTEWNGITRLFQVDIRISNRELKATKCHSSGNKYPCHSILYQYITKGQWTQNLPQKLHYSPSMMITNKIII